jgi:malate dehydrogenase (oxaloacetate-decarboxylating)
MNDKAIIFGLANPMPEILPELAHEAGAAVIATGRSDYPNQLNNVLAFPGIFKGCLKYGVQKITDERKLKAAYSLAASVENPQAEMILPDPFDERVPELICEAMR